MSAVEDDVLNAQEAKPGFEFVRADQIEVRSPDWAIKDYVERDAFLMLFGNASSGKSFIGLDMACSIATGTDYHGHAVQRGAVFILAGEGYSGIGRRLKAWEIARQISLDDAPLFVSRQPAALTEPENVMQVTAAIEYMARKYGKPEFIQIDTLARNFGPADENSTSDMNACIAALDMLRSQWSATIMLVHHTGHADKSRSRGSSALQGALDGSYRIERGDDDVTRLEISKPLKDAESPPPMAFKLRTVELGLMDDDGEPVTSAVPDCIDYIAPKKTKASGKNQARALEILNMLLDDNRANLEEAGHDPYGAKVLREDWKTACDKEGINRHRFAEVFKTLKDRGEITEAPPYVFVPF